MYMLVLLQFSDMISLKKSYVLQYWLKIKVITFVYFVKSKRKDYVLIKMIYLVIKQIYLPNLQKITFYLLYKYWIELRIFHTKLHSTTAKNGNINSKLVQYKFWMPSSIDNF